MTYQVAVLFNNVAGLVALDPQPGSVMGIEAGEWVEAISKAAYPDGSLIWLEWENLTGAQYVALLAAHGQTTALTSVTSEVTVAVPDHGRLTTSNWNAIARHRKGLDAEFGDHLYRKVRFMYHLLEAL